MRILFATPFYEPAWRLGGMAKSTAAWATSLAAAGHDCHVLTTVANGSTNLGLIPKTTVIRDGVKVTYFSRVVASGNRYFSTELFQDCIRTVPAFDVVHSVGLWTFPGLASWAAARFHKVPLVVALHGTLMQHSYDHHGLSKRVASLVVERRRVSNAQRVICTSAIEKSHYLQWSRKDNCATVPLVVRVPSLDRMQARREFRQKYQLGQSKILAFAGRLAANKGIELTVAAFKDLVSAHDDSLLLLIGPEQDNTAKQIRETVRQYGLERKVRFLGLLSGDEYWYAVAGADVFILNSPSENFGLAVAEAAALGVPLLISDQVGIAPYVTKYSAGLVAPLSVEAIGQAMLQMISYHQMAWNEMSHQGQVMVQREFSAQSVAKQLETVYQSVLYENRNIGGKGGFTRK